VSVEENVVGAVIVSTHIGTHSNMTNLVSEKREKLDCFLSIIIVMLYYHSLLAHPFSVPHKS